MALTKILEVTDVRLSLIKTNPPGLLIDADGKVPTTGWTHPELIPYIYKRPPSDGIYDFDFVAQAPDGPSADVITDISAQKELSRIPHGLRGVRVRSSTNAKVEYLLTEADQDPGKRPVSQDGGDGPFPLGSDSVYADARILSCQGLKTRDWSAWNNLMPPKPDDFHAIGEVYVPNPGVVAMLVPSGIEDKDPTVINLDLILRQKSGLWPQFFVWVQARYDKVLWDSRYRLAVVYCEGREIASIKVSDVQ